MHRHGRGGKISPHRARPMRQIRTFITPAVVHNYPGPPDRSDGRTLIIRCAANGGMRAGPIRTARQALAAGG
jgi:hypothetical protein